MSYTIEQLDCAVMVATQHLRAEVERLRAALERAFNELDDILEDWQLEGRHGQPRYEQLKRETDAARIALKSGKRPASETKPKRA